MPKFSGKKKYTRSSTAPYKKRKYASRTPSLQTKKTKTLGLMDLLGVEMKFLDTSGSNIAITAPVDGTGGEMQPTFGCTGCLNAPATGTTVNQREGAKVIGKSMHVDGIVSIGAQAAQAGADNAPEVYIAMVLDRQANGATLSSGQVFVNPLNNSVGAPVPFRNPSFGERYKVLKVCRIHVPPLPIASKAAATIDQDGTQMRFQMYVKLHDLPVKFTTASTTANVTAVIDNAIHMVAYCGDTSTAPTLYYNSRFNYIG